MEALLGESIDPKDIIEFERKYKKDVALGHSNDNIKFEYAWCLVRSPYSTDWKDGYTLLKELYHNTKDEQMKRDCLYYMAIAQYKLKEYDEALKYCDGILKVQPQNHQTKMLKEHIKKTIHKRGLAGMAVVGGASLVFGLGVAAVAALVAAKKK